MKTFSIIIPTLNEEKNITNLLNDIFAQSVKPKQVIVVDGFSTDKTKQLVKQFSKVQLLSCPPQPASQRNLGANHATAQLLYFLDADTRLPQDFFKTTIKKFNNITIACPYYLPYNSNIIIYSIYLFFNAMFFLFQNIAASGAGSCIIINRQAFKQLKGFNFYVKFEDIELIRRASKKYKFKMLPIAIYVSDRRFRKYGILKTTLQYLILSFLFLTANFNTEVFPYHFGKYNSLSSPRRRGSKFED